jgi:4-amino-4-deoxy-L-arabinose transferase-like glycosyltransferase
MSINVNPNVSTRWLLAAMATTALVSGLLYGFTVAPTVTGEDSGELIAAAYTLGIPHPPGYPLWCLTAHAAIKLIPFGEIAWRANLVSALFGVLAACTVTAIVMRLTASFIAGVTGGLSFAFAHEVWEQSTIAEVYTQFAFLFALTLYFVIRWRDTGQARMLYGAAFAAGLGVVAHGLMILPLPVFAAAALWPRDGERPKLKQVGIGSVAFLLPFLLLLYLPIRSAANPEMDWGNPETLGAFWDVMTRTQYSDLFTSYSRSWSMFLDQLSFFWYETGMWEFYLGMSFLGAGLIFHFRKSAGLLLALLFCAVIAGSILLTNFPLELPDTWLISRFWIPAYVVTGIWTGCVVGFFRVRIKNLLACILIVFSVASLILGFKLLMIGSGATDQPQNRYVYEYAENVLLTLPEDAIYIGGGDHTLFPLLYLQIVEARRSDVTIANPYGYIDMQRIDGLSEAFPEEALKVIPSEESEQAMVAWIAEHSRRPVYSANPLKLENYRSTRHGVLYRIATPGDTLDDPYSIWDAYAFDEQVDVNDWTSRLIQFDYFAAAVVRDLAKGERAQARTYLLSAATFANWKNHYGGGNKHSFNNLAIIAARGDMPALAEEFWLRALEIDPGFELARGNLETFRARQRSQE